MQNVEFAYKLTQFYRDIGPNPRMVLPHIEFHSTDAMHELATSACSI